MDATSRNRVLMVGGALVVTALLLVCGPLEGQFDKNRAESTPPVAAAPPPVIEAEPEVIEVVPEADVVEEAPAVVEAAPVVPVVPAPVVANSGSSGPKAAPPPVSAPPPPAPVVAAVPIVTGPSDSELAQKAFDGAPADDAKSDLRKRFAPDVDSGPGGSLLGPDVFAEANPFQIRPCDTPGAACRNPVPRTVARVPAGIPVITPGTR